MKLRYERGALADLDEIFRYIAKDNRRAAAQLVARIEQATALIAEQPHWGGNAQSQISTNSDRQLPVYEVGSNEVIVHYVRHGARLRPWEGE